MNASTVPVSAAPEVIDSESAHATFAVHAYPTALRWLAMLAQGVSLGSILFFTAQLLSDVVSGTQTVQPGPVGRGLVFGGLLPLALVAVLRGLTRARVAVEPSRLVLTLRGGERFELPFDALAGVHPAWVPLPGPGLTLRLRTGRTFGRFLETQDPSPLLEALSTHGPLGAARTHPLVRYAQARQAMWLRRPHQLALKHVGVPLLITGVFFRAHQYIAFGGWLGEYQMHGLTAYLKTFGRFWVPVTLSLVLYACFWRALAEVLSFSAAWLGPRWARNTRRGAEWLCRLAYYGGLPALLLVRFYLM
ncbi:hypothetical protein [Citreicoccus inhibens]|uniref:hypothetical protein n=1 Tax=Citreicoccus inhibens TaxID=2849499 RepID=UPI001F2EC0B7|nr:hypothetical protein [Citreicoccus inhibens]